MKRKTTPAMAMPVDELIDYAGEIGVELTLLDLRPGGTFAILSNWGQTGGLDGALIHALDERDQEIAIYLFAMARVKAMRVPLGGEAFKLVLHPHVTVGRFPVPKLAA